MPIDEKTRVKLSKPFGPLMEFKKALGIIKRRKGILIAVGDQTILNLLENNIFPDIGVYDGMTRREPICPVFLKRIGQAAKVCNVHYAKNPAGMVSSDMEKKIKLALSEGRGWVCVEGEDDLASLVIMANAKKGTLLLYGQPKEGVVAVIVEDTIRKKAENLIKKIHN